MLTEKSSNLLASTSQENKKVESFQAVQMNIQQSLQFQGKQHVQGKQSCILASVAYSTYQSSGQGYQPKRDNTVFCNTVQYWRSKLQRTNRSSNFLRSSYNNSDNIKNLNSIIQFKKDNPSILKDYFSSRNDPPIFTLIAPKLFKHSKQASSLSPALKSTNHFYLRPQYLADQIQVQKTTLVVTTNQKPDQSQSRE